MTSSPVQRVSVPLGLVLTVRGLRKEFPARARGGRATVAVADVALEVPAGAFASVLGPSGSGKTTLLRCIAGFERPDAGVITIHDREVVSARTFVRPFDRGVGVVPQEGALFPHLSVAQNIGFGLVGAGRHQRRERVAELLELVGLPGLGQRRPDQLSGGEQQRVALARALAPEPHLILLDEPFSALDAQLRVTLREEVRQLLRDLRSTAVLVTHDQSEALSLSDHLVVMAGGRVVASGDPRSVYEQPTDQRLGRFLGEALVLPGEVAHTDDGVRVTCALGRLPVAHWHGADGPCDVLIRPEHIEVRALPASAMGGDRHVTSVIGTICSQSYFGHDALLHVEVVGLPGPISVRVPGLGLYRTGEQAELRVTRPVSTFPRRRADLLI